jgi:dTDP-4-dehydrorhamnose 3,5-epimerase
MKFISTRFKDLYVIEPKFFTDERGGFMRIYDVKLFQEFIPNFSGQWKQMNHSFNSHKGTFRGLHYQEAPYQEVKCIRCVSGAVIDFALDLRKNSKTFLEVFEVELSAKNQKMIYIPKGFAHGFYTIEDNSELVYMHDEFYQSDFDRGLCYKDESIKTKIDILPLVISEKDKNYKRIEKNFKGI